MSKSTGTIDYSLILRRMSAETRQEIYSKLIKGQDGVPGIEEQFVNCLVEARSFADALARREQYEPEGEEQVVQHAKDLASMRYLLYTKNERLETIGAELTRLQDALEEITGAGTGASV